MCSSKEHHHQTREKNDNNKPSSTRLPLCSHGIFLGYLLREFKNALQAMRAGFPLAGCLVRSNRPGLACSRQRHPSYVFSGTRVQVIFRVCVCEVFGIYSAIRLHVENWYGGFDVF